MNYMNSTIQYVFKNLWYIVLLSVLPGICLSGMADIGAMHDFYSNFFTGKLSEITWPQIFHTFSIYRFSDGLSVLLSVVSFFAIVLCASLLLALIDKHMRIGKRTLNGIVNKLNDNVLSTCGITLLFSAIYEVWALIFASLTFAIFATIPILALQYVLFVLLLIFGGFALLYVITLFYLWLPCIQITGFQLFEALRYTNQITENIKRRLIVAMATSVVIGNILIVPAAIFLPPLIVYVIMLLVYMFYFMLFTVRMEVVYFDAAQLEREDLKTRYHE